jgi:hypothetical protein
MEELEEHRVDDVPEEHIAALERFLVRELIATELDAFVSQPPPSDQETGKSIIVLGSLNLSV